MAADLSIPIAARAISGFSQFERDDLGLRDWIVDGTYTFLEVDSETFSLERVSIEKILPRLACDFWKPCFATIDSLCVQHVNSISEKSLAWKLIRQYYAAYFGANALMRLMNAGLIRIERAQASHLSTIGSIFMGKQIDIEPAQYVAELRDVDKFECKILFSKVSSSPTGDYQKFWFQFNEFLKNLADDIALVKDIDATDLVARISEISSVLRSLGYGNAGWLSAMRNSINYQFSNGLWYPHNGFQKIDKPMPISLNSATIRLDFDASKQPLTLFNATTIFVSKLCIETTNRIMQHSDAKSDSSKRWKNILKLLANSA